MWRSPQVIEHLVAGDRVLAQQRARLLQIGDVEVRDAERADLALVDQLLERAQRLGQRDAAAPVQQVDVEVVGAEAAQALLAGAQRARRGWRSAAAPC